MSAAPDLLIPSLRERLPRRPRRALGRPQRAAVLVPIVDDGGPLRLLLTRRTEDLPTHAGQVAFPGGLVEPGEEDPVNTALREADEEVGLPKGAVEVLGLLDDFPTRPDTVAVTPETLWGLSARIVLHLLEVSDLGSPVPLRPPEYS